jgi:hypothetical protein
MVQDIEYNEAVEAALVREEEAIDARVAEAEKERRAEAEAHRKADELAALIRAMPPEPEKGAAIAVAMPAGNRITRRFNPDHPAKWAHVWVASHSATTDTPLQWEAFDLVATVGGVRVEPARTFRDQGIIGRVLLAISLP